MTAPAPTSAADVRRLALSLPGTTEAPHFDRAAFRARRIFATLPRDGTAANLRLSPEDQAHWCALLPAALRPVPNGWGARGWTEVLLDRIDLVDLETILQRAWLDAGGRMDERPLRGAT
ncbi:YjbR [Chelatococcus sambhunathii]|uniref:YjbR n=1 Tax=Chelatococcus sambhunathii TaxID=363953 RepID=A0ABM9U0D8_9HYPH|nr:MULTISPECIES: MmcQ/YjbR family DNA-binding protein [Chelatococcus]CUA84913.1 YjbR [Chelatococcus sambhunathii]